MHQHHSLTRGRLRRVLSDKLKPAIRAESVPFTIAAWAAEGEPPSVSEALVADYEEISPGSRWGRPWGTTWFRLDAAVPPSWAGATIEATIDLGFTNLTGFQAEGLIWVEGADGVWVPWKGLHPLNHRIVVAESHDEVSSISILVEAASNPTLVAHKPHRESDLATAGTDPIYVLGRIQLNTVERDVEALVLDYEVLGGLLDELGPESVRGAQISVALEHSLDALDFDDVVGSASAARGQLKSVLASPAETSAHQVSAIGHAHIDTAWLWPIRETKRKCSRTFSNVLRLMEEYPEFKFVCSQAVQYSWMKQDFPSIYEEICARVAEGRWITTGGMWVEADTNLPSGESLIRQFLHGQSFFAEEFGHRDTEVWIPDVFGYPASLPQIMRISGFDRFLTQKLSWNKTNRFPHNSFQWEGIDGSTVFTHFPSVETYNAQFTASELRHTVAAFKDHGPSNHSLMPFGFGDGGGGPTKKMMERFRRVRDLEGSPRIEIESPTEFFDKVIADYAEPPRWVGELYFEMHRGTFTSQARTKAGNRRCERLLSEAELWCAAAYGTQSASGYPQEQLGSYWQEVLTQQFHDILPGSSIGWVHREAEETHGRVIDGLETLIGCALDELTPTGTASIANSAPVDHDGVVVFAGSDDVSETVGTASVLQHLSDGSFAANVVAPARSVEPFRTHVVEVPVRVTDGAIENGILTVRFDQDGLIRSIWDHRVDREVVAEGGVANRLALHPDFPNEYDAWDLDEFYKSRVTYLDEAVEIVVLDEGPLIARVRIDRVFGASTISQTISLRAGSPRVDIDTQIDWQEREKVLKAEFPLDLHGLDVSREIQFGHVTTPIHTNTSWDTARFEICAHRWIDVSEHGYGVALLNDSKYGHDVERSQTSAGIATTTMRLTLLRAANYPDPVADLGHHHFRYSLLPHPGDLAEGDVVAEGYRVNNDLRLISRPAADPSPVAPIRVATSSDPAVIIETVKPAHDDSGDLIVRGYEAHGSRATADIDFGFGVAEVAQVDALEGVDHLNPCGLLHDGNRVTLGLRPFQIFSLRIRPA